MNSFLTVTNSRFTKGLSVCKKILSRTLLVFFAWLLFFSSAFSQGNCTLIPNSINGFIYMGEYNGSKYFCSDDNDFDWDDAVAAATAAGGHLVVVNDAGENNFLKNNIIASYAWIGYTDEDQEGNFEWVDGSASGYTNWNSGEPNNQGTGSGHADHTVIKKDNGKWYDRNEHDEYEFVMEIPCPPVNPPGGDCDVVIAYWDLEDCESNSGNGSNNDYNEFAPTTTTPNGCGGNTMASNVFRDNGSHSCTPGVNGSVGMCVGTRSSCDFINDDEYALRFEVTIKPGSNGTATLSGLSFFEKAPTHYEWIGGSSGSNNYPTKYGIRVTVDGQQVFRQTNISTTQSWSFESFDFTNDPDFTVTANTTFSFELRGYCRVGNGASQAVWDIDEIKVYGCCDGPCVNSGGDTDGDSICDDDDCAPNDPNLPTIPGTACNDGNPNTVNDVILSDGCSCAGTFDPCVANGGDSDGDGTCDNDDCAPYNPNLPTTPGTACNDGNPNTSNDVIQADGCSCAGTPNPPICENVTFGGTIGFGANCAASTTVCNADVPTIINCTSPGGGNGAFEIIWLKAVNNPTCIPPSTTVDNIDQDPFWSVIPGETGLSLSPGAILQKTCYLRCTRRAGCTTYIESNIIMANLDPNCGGGGTPDCENDISISTGNGTITVSGLDGAPVSSLQIFTSDWTQQLINCFANCNATETVQVPAGTYYVYAKYYTAAYQLICEKQATVTVGGGGGPCANAGGDSDGDGTCDNDDCRPNNPNFPTTPGSSCNDGNPNTTNDVVQSDGCTCAGVPAGQPCTADAGALVANQSPVDLQNGSAIIAATQTQQPVIPNGFQRAYVLTQGAGLVIQATNSTPTFTVTTPGDYTIHTLVFDPVTLDLGVVVPGQTTGFDVNSLLIQGGGSICASLDVPGAPIKVNPPNNGNPDCENDIDISTGNGTIIVSGLDGAPISSLQIFTSDWSQQLKNCFANCSATETVSVPAGTYLVYAKYYTASYTLICEKKATVTVGGGPDPCDNAGGDSDGDGTCDDDDCQPDNPNFPATPGTPCNDGNPNTVNDVVTSNGCGCAGTPVNTGCTPAPLVVWDLDACASCSNGSNAVWDELTPAVQGNGGCSNISATGFVPVDNGDTHSCTPGQNNTAVCVDAGTRFRFSVTLNGNDGKLSGLSFYEKAPDNYVWSSPNNVGCSGSNNGPNNPPGKFDLKVFKNGTLVFSTTENTQSDWNLRTFNFSGNSDFTANGTTTFMFELRAHSATGSGPVKAWDIDEITVMGCCDGNNDPCANAGGDSDGDGTCNNDDCQPNNPNFPAVPGTTCNDGNANTTNDVVQSDGCTCAGTPVGGGQTVKTILKSPPVTER